MKYKLLGGIILLAVVLIFVQGNIAAVPIRFLEWERSAPLSLLLLGTLLAGILLGMMFSFARRQQKSRKIKKAERAQQKQAQEAAKSTPKEPTSTAVELEKTPVLDASSNQ